MAQNHIHQADRSHHNHLHHDHSTHLDGELRGEQSRPRRTRPCRHGGRLPPPVLDRTGPDRSDPAPLACRWTRARADRRHRVSGLALGAAGPVQRRLLLRRLAVPHRALQRVEAASARDDDAHLARHQRGVFLLGRGGAGPERKRPVLGAGHSHRHHAAGALDRDEVGDGSLRRAQSTGRAAARHRTSAGCGWQPAGCRRERPATWRSRAGQARRARAHGRADRRGHAPASTSRCSPASPSR